jgi:pantoate--beta-alanine ligase
MQIFNQIILLKSFLKAQKQQGKTIGLVPTMGALHRGHLELIKQSNQENDITICSIYVNPIQFNHVADLEKYPRVLDEDVKLLSAFANTFIFAPTDVEMYAQRPSISFDFGDLEKVMEGYFRPGHFNGVAIVVAKLFHIVQPNKAYFGQKDLQQCAVIKKLVDDLSFDLELVICPTVREDDGLALSSRNKRLTESERQLALAIPQALFMAKEMVEQKSKTFVEVKNWVEAFLKVDFIRLEYFNIVNAQTLQEIENESHTQNMALCMAAFVGEVRLIDNVLISLS